MTTRSTAADPVVVVGAGMAGLAAARELGAAGLSVVVLERRDRPGGRVDTRHDWGFPVEAGAQFMAGFFTNALRLVDEVGLGGELVPVSRSGAVLRGGRTFDVRAGVPSISSSLVSAGSKLRMLGSVASAVRHRKELDVHRLSRAWRLDTRSVRQWATSPAGPGEEAFDYIVEPALNGFLYADADRTSQVAWLLNIRYAARVGGLFTLRRGLGSLVDRLVERVDVRLGSPVVDVRGDAGRGFVVTTGGRDEPIHARAIVCATPASEVPGTLPEMGTERARLFDGFAYVSTTVVVARIGRRLPGSPYAILLPPCEGHRLTLAAILSARGPGAAPAGADVVHLYPSAAAGSALQTASDEDVVRELLGELAAFGPEYDTADHVETSRVERWSPALPLMDVGFFRRIAEFERRSVEWPGVVFAGDYLGGPSIEGAVTSGEAAARRLLRAMGRAA